MLRRTLARPAESVALTLIAYSVSFWRPPTKVTKALRGPALERSAMRAPVVKPPVDPPPIAVRLRSTTWMRAGVSVSTRIATALVDGYTRAVRMQSTAQPTFELRSPLADA